jgi:hypothetical protein
MGRKLLLLALLAPLGACNGPQQAPASVATTPPVGEDKPAAPEAAPFRVDVTPPASCVRATPCEATIALTALDGFKVNADYPMKFVGDVGPQISFDGTGTFAAVADKKTGTMTIKFRSEAAGTIKVSGTFKLSVCTDEVCKIEQPKIAFDVPVT